MNDNTRGLYQKYHVVRVDENGQPKAGHEGRRYFVLDVNHDEHAIEALEAYAKSCAAEYPALSEDLSHWVASARLQRVELAIEQLRTTDADPVVIYDLERMKKSIESGTISFPPGLTREERRAYIKNRDVDSQPSGS